MEDVIVQLANSSAYMSGIHFPLEDVAEILDENNRPEHALAIRVAIEVCRRYEKTTNPEH